MTDSLELGPLPLAKMHLLLHLLLYSAGEENQAFVLCAW